MSKIVYGLVAESNPEFIFYVGCTDNPYRRESQHRRAAFNESHPEYNTNKYRFIRELREVHCEWRLQILSDELEVDETHDEYSWILRAARENEENGNIFYDNMPLTNMKAGDFLEEMLRDKNFQSISPSTVKDYIEKRKREVSYEREGASGGRNKALLDAMNEKAEEMRQEKAEKIEKKIKRLEKQLDDQLKYTPHNVATIAEIEKEIKQLRLYVKLFDEQ